jgi:hypothetical protein
MAEQEIIEKKARFARGKKKLAKEGRYNGGRIPFGYKVDREHANKIVIDEESSKIVHEIFERYENGESQLAIAKNLHDRGIMSGGNVLFNTSSIHQILTNELLCGRPHKSKGASYERRYPQIITPEQYDRCREKAKENDRLIDKSRNIYYSIGLIECPNCHRTFVGSGNKGYYHCRGAVSTAVYNGMHRCENNTCISVNIMDSILWELSIDYEANYQVIYSSKRIEYLEAQLQELSEKINAEDKLIKEAQIRFTENVLKINAIKDSNLGLDVAIEEQVLKKLNSEKEKYKKNIRYIENEKSSNETDKLAIEREIAHIKNSTDKYTAINNQTDEPFEVDTYSLLVDNARKKIREITDDAKRQEIVHNNIESVIINRVIIDNHWIGDKTGTIKAKEIIVQPSKIRFPEIKKPRVLFFFPFDGKKGRTVFERVQEEDINMFNGKISYHYEWEEFQYEYLKRIRDPYKIRKAKERKENLKQMVGKFRQEGYIPSREMKELYDFSIETIRGAMRSGLIRSKKIGNEVYGLKDDFVEFCAKHKPRRKT